MKLKSLFLAALLGVASSVAVQAKLNVVATLPDFGSLATLIGGEHVEVTSIARGTEDPHFVDARPSFLRVLNRADLLLEGGADLEVGWLPTLLNGARNPRIAVGAPGHVVMSEGISLLETPTGPIDRSMGDVHPGGNPHYWLDPANGKIMAEHLAAVFARADPEHEAAFQKNLQQFKQRLDKKLTEWTARLEPFRGTKVVTYHKSYEYLARRFKLEIIGQLEPKPGIEPSPSHIKQLIPQMKQAGVRLVLIEPNRPRKKPAYVAEATGAKVLVLPGMVGGDKAIKDYFDLFDYAVSHIAEALKESQ